MKRIGLIIILLAALIACNKKQNNYTHIEGFTQGTTFSITYYDSLNRDFRPQIDSILNRIDQSMSIYNASSLISQINSNQTDSIDNLLKEVINASFDIYRKSEGAFDITVGPVIRAIGFGPDKTQGIDSAKIRSLQHLIGMDKISVEGNRLIKKDSLIQIDVNAIAQGYTVDVIADFFKRKSVQNYLVEVGGEIVANGISPRGKEWIIGIDKPIKSALPGENIQVKVTMSSGFGLATSGNYRKFIEVDGQKYSHTINPKTGFPELNSLLSATVIAPNATIADGLATAFMVKGLEWAKAFVEKEKDIDVYLIYSTPDGKYEVWMNKGLEKRIIP
jgi:thiamine biosynthesis lipoprotein